MKQVLQDLSGGETKLEEIPVPKNKSGCLLIQTGHSVISAGTERMLVDFGKANWIEKARQQPDKVKMVLDKVKTDGLQPTIEAVRSKLDQPLPLGYCNSGVVVDSQVPGFEVGDRVVSNGGHSDIVRVPGNLCAKIPEGVDGESAAFTVLGSIALQGIRLAKPTIGESVAVIGLGLIGLIAVQILRANGCRVLGIDFDEKKCELARGFGAEVVNLGKGQDPVKAAMAFSRDRGMDAVIITAATKSNKPMSNAAHMSRKRGRIVLVGVVGLELSRADLYEKELTFQVSCSYGPGRYDPFYEEKGNDYPIGFVRWTEQRNFEAVLDMMESGALDMKPLITHRYDFSDALEGYEQLDNKSALGIVLNYDNENLECDKHVVNLSPVISQPNPSKVICVFLGGGNYASRILFPAFKEAGAHLDALVTSGGISAVHQGKKHGFNVASTDESIIDEQVAINTVVIATRHNQHARQVVNALNGKKHVFVEKPLAITLEDLSEVESTYKSVGSAGVNLMVGFNRRFAPHVVKLKSLMEQKISPKVMVMTVNAGDIPSDHWTQDMRIGGGRIIGEGCHFIDLLRYLADSKIIDFNVMQIGEAPGAGLRDDKVVINLAFENGSVGTIHYLSNGDKAFPKERLEVFCEGGVVQLDNFRKMKGYGWPGFSKMNLMAQDKGQKQCIQAFVDSIRNGLPAPIAPDELFEVSRVTIEIANKLER